MAHVDYSAAGIPIRDDLTKTHGELLEHLRAPGTWWTGAERVAIAAESRHALDCALCRERKDALSPSSVKGEHDSLGALPEAVVDVIHRVRTDPARLSKSWFDGVMAAGVSEEAYVEVIGVVTLLAGIDYTARALGAPPPALPDPLPGEPSRHHPATARPGVAWVPMIDPADADGDEAVLARERTALRGLLTPEAFVDAAAVIGAFNVVDRIANATGIPLDAGLAAMSGEVREELDLARFSSSANTPGAG